MKYTQNGSWQQPSMLSILDSSGALIIGPGFLLASPYLIFFLIVV